MIRKVLCLMAILLLVGVAGAIPSLSDYGNTTTLKINITPSMEAQTDYPIKFIFSNSSGISNYYAPDNIVYTNGTTRPDWYDINVTDSSDIPLPFWVENNTATAYNATVWVKVPTIAVDNSSGLKWRYGNSSQSQSTANLTNTFLFGDDFITSLDTATKWTIVGDQVTVSNGIATIQSGSGDVDRLVSKYIISGTNRTLQSRLYPNHYADTTRVEQFAFRNHSSFKGQTAEYADVPGAAVYQNSDGTVSNSAMAGWSSAYHIQTIKRNTADSTFYADNGNAVTISAHYYTDNSQIVISTAVSGARVYVDWVFIRKSVPVEPTTSLYSTTPSVVAELITAAFTASSNPSTVNTAVSFTDASTGTPTTWNWTIDGTITNTTQSAAYFFSTAGTHSVDLNVTNSTGHFSNITHNQVVNNASGWNQLDLEQDGQYITTFTITDSSTGAAIPVVIITSSGGQSNTTSTGTGSLTYPAGVYTAYFSATGYVGKSMSFIVDGDSTDTVQMVASTGAPQQSTWYTPWQVRIRIVDYYGAPLPNINVTANYIASSLPSTDTTWLVSAFGINTNVANDMLNSNVAMAGNTDDNGGLSFTMFKSIQYRLTITNSTLSVASTKTLYPSDQEYVIYVRTAGQGVANNTLAMRNGTLPWYSVNSSHINLNMTYVDTSLCTSQLVFRVWFRDNSTEVHNTTWSGFGASYVYDNHTVAKAPIGTEYLWGYNATTIC